ncbi:hypothetical protein [Neosynechococcus sphagnicola]|uniref:hypothetical protein n=1 Tax=Neosynechococcus sphagnicola TaxID=1501145 RepID=UPI0012E031D5|nr:hypothetical protein [Neosynechococcus sphagnicola]
MSDAEAIPVQRSRAGEMIDTYLVGGSVGSLVGGSVGSLVGGSVGRDNVYPPEILNVSQSTLSPDY